MSPDATRRPATHPDHVGLATDHQGRQRQPPWLTTPPRKKDPKFLKFHQLTILKGLLREDETGYKKVMLLDRSVFG
jgi:hypothetical protein